MKLRDVLFKPKCKLRGGETTSRHGAVFSLYLLNPYVLGTKNTDHKSAASAPHLV